MKSEEPEGKQIAHKQWFLCHWPSSDPGPMVRMSIYKNTHGASIVLYPLQASQH